MKNASPDSSIKSKFRHTGYLQDNHKVRNVSTWWSSDIALPKAKQLKSDCTEALWKEPQI